MSVLLDLLGSLAKIGFTWLSRQRLPKISGSLTLPGLVSSVEVLRDQWGIPHIFASNLHDLFFAQGFVHAQDRLWQMELNRRIAQGRLSELFGEIALDTDRATRTFGFNRLGATDWQNANQEIKDVISAYAEGINAFLKDPSSKLPIEFSLLRHQPEPWQPQDTTAFARVMIWQLSHAWYSEIVRAQVIQTVGEEHAAELEIHYPPENPITLPSGIEFNRLDLQGMLQKTQGPFLQRGMGSNAWAISGSKSITGKPILCNDMHLALGIPCLWYENHLVADNINIFGVSLPGVPLVLVGHNDHIAWGMTLAFTDCEDLFVEQLDTQNPTRYLFKDKWVDVQIIPEVILVKGRSEPHIENVAITHHGPIISDVIGHPEQRLAVQSMALQPSPAMQGWLLLNQAQGWNDFVEAMRLIEAPQLNVAYADVEGNIGYWVTGKVPIRAKGTGMIPAPGWTGEYEWQGIVPFEEMPHALNPQAGYLVTCNHKVVPDDYPYFLGTVWMNGYRARRITEVLASKEKLTMDDLRSLHTDFFCIPGLEFVKRLSTFQSDDPDVKLALQYLCAWDGYLTANSIAGTIYEVTRYTLVRNLLEPGLGTELTLQLMGQGFHPILLASHEFYGHDTVALLRLMDKPDSWWVKQAGGWEKVLTTSIKQAIAWLRSNLGPEVEDWRWGRIHRAIFPHALGAQKPLDRVFNRGPFPIGGDTDTPCQTAMHPHDPYDNKAWAPSFRQVIDLGDLAQSEAIIPPGQSGHLGSPHYDDFAMPWLKGEYHPLLWTRQQIESHLEGKLTLEPQKLPRMKPF